MKYNNPLPKSKTLMEFLLEKNQGKSLLYLNYLTFCSASCSCDNF